MNIDLNMNEITSVEKIISNVLIENDFNEMSNLIQKSLINKKFLFPNSEECDVKNFISKKTSSARVYLKVITEDEFFKIVGASKRGISKNSGRYQEHLYGNYKKAVKLNDEGYISDVLNKALKFEKELKYVKSLMKNKTFVENWRRDFKEETAVELFKRKGELRIVNIVKERAQ